MRATKRLISTPQARAYGLAIAASIVALLVALLVSPVDANANLAALLFLGAVGLSGWYGGLRPALLATAFGASALDYFFETPPYSLAVSNPATVTDLVAFLVVAILLGSLNGRLRTANDRLRAERDRAEAAVRARDDVMEAVSHDLRTPLTTIKVSAYTLHDASAPLAAETRERLVTNIEAEADRLVHFVAGALELRRLENGLTPVREWNALGEVVSAVLDRCTPALGERPVEFAIPDDLPLVFIDAAMLAQALTVLLENVSVHTPPGTPLAIDGSFCDGGLRVGVSDAGSGIPEADRERVFQKYERLAHQQPGLGLGLAIARATVEAQGGHLRIEDSPLGGARFVLAIPNVPVHGSRA